MQPNAYRSELFSGVSADETSAVRDVSPFNCLVVCLTGTGTTSGGVITIEEADEITHAGTWSLITTVNASDITGGKTFLYHVAGGGGIFAFGALRVRISDAITGGGTVAAVLRGN